MKKGGLNVKSCPLQARALAAKQINEIITEKSNKPWLCFARRWTSKSLTHLQPDYTRFLSKYAPQKTHIIHTSNGIPQWYNSLCNTAHGIKELFKNKNELPSCKLTYTTLLEYQQNFTSEYVNQCNAKWVKVYPKWIIYWNHIWNSQ